MTYKNVDNCNETDVLYTRKMSKNGCFYLKQARLTGSELINGSAETGSAGTGSSVTGRACIYEILCKEGDVTCTMELVIFNTTNEFSICEIYT